MASKKHSNRKPWEKGRKAPQPRHIQRLLILCEDSKSSVLYFQAFPFDPDYVSIECVGTGYNTKSLMLEAIRRKTEALDTKKPYSQIWVVFDGDSFPRVNFNAVFGMARPHREIEICWSNECFELWYLLHFDYRDTAIGRKELIKELNKHLDAKYAKSSQDIYKQLEAKQSNGLRNAKKLMASKHPLQRRENPSTRVYELVERLNEFAIPNRD